MGDRGKRLVELARVTPNTAIGSLEKKEQSSFYGKNNLVSDVDEIDVFEVDDPGIEFEKHCNQEIEMKPEHESNDAEDQSKSETEATESSVNLLQNNTIGTQEKKEESSFYRKNEANIDNSIYDVHEIDEFEVNDPWIEFKKWKTNIIEKRSNQGIQMESEHESNDAGEENKSETEVIESSTSWKPDENECDSTEYMSSEQIPVSKSIMYEEQFHMQEDNNNDIDNANTTILQDISFLLTRDENNSNTTTIAAKNKISIQSVGIIGDSKKLVDISHRKSRIWDKKDRCVYCNRDVTNFSRHLLRNHEKEDSVLKIVQLPKGDKKRKHMINLLRKEGNLTLLDENKIRPVQRATQNYEKRQGDVEEAQEFMPCPYCKGIYRLGLLRKHSKICSYKPHNGDKCNIASLGQNLLVFKASRKSFFDKLRLKTEVFPKMHADRASFNGKNDPVICQYGEDYLRKHKRPHIRNAVSNKIRELGRLLIPLQDIYGLATMQEAMNTKNYEKVIHAAQIICGYDATSKMFKSPSLAMHLKTILLAACLAAKTLLLKQDPVLPITDYTRALKSVKNFRSLVNERWKFDMGSLALKDLNEKHGKKYQTLPITSDVIKFKQYALSIAERSMDILNENFNDVLSFKQLTESVLVLTILLNRKRVGDVQYIKLDSYTQSTTNKSQEECLKVLTEAEKVLSAHFKRIITIGKGSKSIPILFPKNVQRCVEVLLSSREKNNLIPTENPFLFALIGSKEKWVDGSSVLRKYAASCGAVNPKTLTSSRLRKQIATVLQLLNLNETEKEQMASFMGHTKKTHEEFYRLPQDVYQTAKIAKLLLMMDKGVGAEYHGKALEEIDVNLESFNECDLGKKDSDSESSIGENEQTAECLENEVNFSSKPYEGTSKENNMKKIKDQQRGWWSNKQKSVIEENEQTAECLEDEINSSSESDEGTIKKNNRKKVKDRQRGSWSNKQKSVMKEFFKKHIRDKITPRKHECLKIQNDHEDMFKDKTWMQIKVFVYNIFRDQKRS